MLKTGEYISGWEGHDKTRPEVWKLCQTCKFRDIPQNAYPCGYCFIPFGDYYEKAEPLNQ